MVELNSTHQLRVFSNVFTDEPCETYDIPHGVILGEWLRDNIEGFNPDETQLAYSSPFDHPVTADVDCHFVPKKGAVKSVTKAFKKVVGFVGQLFGLKKPKVPSASSPLNNSRGDDLELSAAKNQTVKFGMPIRESFGLQRIVPDYIIPPRSYFAADGKRHWTEGLLCIGVGDYEIADTSVLISNSPIVGLGGDNRAVVYPPNASLASESAARWWHTCPEVGPTSTGSSGLELGITSDVTRTAVDGSYIFSGKSVTPSSGQSFPLDWESGMYLDIEILQSYQVRGNAIVGNFDGLQVTAGDQVELSGDISGKRTVSSYTPQTVTDIGAPSIWSATSTPELDYDLDPAQFTIIAGGSTAFITLTDDFLTQDELVYEINRQLSSSALSGMVEISAGLVITELPNYSAKRIAVTGISGAVRVFGSVTEANLNTVIGTARVESEPAKLTLNNLGFSGGPARLSINKVGSSFVITGASGGLVTLDRVDSLGVSDWFGWTTGIITASASIELAPDSLEGGWVGVFAATPGDELADQLEFDVFMPEGLIHYNSDGAAMDMPVHVYFRYREGPGDTWKQISKPFQARTPDQFGKTFTVDLPRPMRVKECQMRRRFAARGKQNISDKLEWFGLRARMARQINSYPNLTTLAFKLDGKSTSYESEAQISVIATRKLGGVPTRSIKDAVSYIARTAEINGAPLNYLDSIWQGRGDNFDFQFNSFKTIKDAVNTALSVGFSELTIRQGLLTPVRDAKRAPELLQAFNHTYSAQNTTAPIVEQASWPDDDDPDGYDVEYIDEISWRVETVKCRLPGNTERKIEKIKADGITNRRKAYQWGMRQLMTALTESVSYSTSTELDARNNWYGDYVNFVQEIPDWSQTALVHGVSSDGLIIGSSEPLNWEGAAHSIALQRPDGTMSAVKVANRIDDYTVSISSPFSFAPRVMETVIVFGQTERLTNPAIVRSVAPSGDKTKISGIAYNEQKYLYDDAALPPEA